MAAAKTPESLRPPLPISVWLICGGVTLLLVSLSARYGFHRDELYFVVAGRQLDWGFVDQPPLVPLLAGFIDALPGQITPTVLRLLPAIAAGVSALVAALLARRFGGHHLAMAMAAAAVGGMGVVLATGHLFSTATFEILAAALLILVVARLLDEAKPREWLWVGLLAGLAGLNKFTAFGIVAALVVGILLSPRRRVLFSWWTLAAAGLAAILVSPTLLWQINNGWPQLEMTASIRADSDGPLMFLVLQLVGLSLLLAIPAVAGGLRLLRLDGGRWRAFPLAWLMLTVGYLLIGGAFYYTAPLYIPLLAAGACWLAALRPWPRGIVAAVCLAAMVAASAVALPLVPQDRIAAVNEINTELGETVGWPELVDQVATEVEALPIAQRKQAVIATGNYGEASALLVLGEDLDLPPVVSGHNNYWLWGPPSPPRTGPVVAVGGAVGQLAPFCPDMTEVSRIANDANVANEEQGQSIALCPSLDKPLAAIWPELRHYD